MQLVVGGCGVSVSEDKKVMEMNGSDGTQRSECT